MSKILNLLMMKNTKYLLVALMLILGIIVSSCEEKDSRPRSTDLWDQPMEGGGDDDDDPIILGDTTQIDP